MLKPGPARKVILHLNDDIGAGRDFLHNEIFAFLFENGVAGATLSRPQAGFGSHHQLHSSETGQGNHEHLPVRIEFIESLERVDALLPLLCERLTDGLIETQDTTVIKSAAREQPR
jgi:PII-like signaling protein